MASIASRLNVLKSRFPREAFKAGAKYLRRNPKELLTLARGAAGLRLVIPLDALRWLLEKLPSKKGPKDLVLGAAPPAISIAATSELMGNAFRAAADVRIDEIQASPDSLLVALRVSHLKLDALGADQNSPMANLFKSMPLDRPGHLVNFLPQRPPALVEASNDKLVVDLLKVPKIASNPIVRRALEVVTPVLSIGEVRTEDDRLVVSLKIRTTGVSQALAALRR